MRITYTEYVINVTHKMKQRIYSAALSAWCSLTWWIIWMLTLSNESRGVLAARWAHSALLHPDYRLLWALGPRDVTFEVQARTLGYIGFGLSRDGRVAGADMVVGWVDDGQVYFQDRHIKETHIEDTDREPEIDASQDYQLLLGYENATHTVLRFRRKLDTCDVYDVAITNDTLRVLWSMHPLDPKRGGLMGSGALPSQSELIRGVQSIYLMQRVNQEVPKNEEIVNTWELRNFRVSFPPSGGSLHWCRVFQLPNIIGKQHVIRYEPILDDTGQRSLKHAVLYECQKNKELLKLVNQQGQACYESSSPFLSCRTMVARWARGSEGFSFPPETGYPLEPSSNVYYMLETYYSISTEYPVKSTDSSGLRIYYTPELRRYDAGVISVGIEPNWRHIIPPGQQNVVSSGHCISECTRQAFSNSGIHIFAVGVQTNKIGRKVRFRQIRGSTEQPPISTDENFDFDYGEYRQINMPVRVLPGDHLIAECTYNSLGRTTITLGGRSSREETCLVTALYYPRQKTLTVCHSLPSLPTVLHSLGIQNLQPGSNPLRISAPSELAGMTLESRLVTYDWQNQFNIFQDATRRGSFKPLCWSASSSLIQGTDNMETYSPNITHYYQKSPPLCETRSRGANVGATPSSHLPTQRQDNNGSPTMHSKVLRSPDSVEHSLALSGTRTLSATLLSSVAVVAVIVAYY